MRKLLIIIFGTMVLSVQAQKQSLQQCVESALRNNAALKSGKLEVQMAAEEKSAARTNYFPQVSAMGAGFIGSEDLMRTTMELPPQMGGISLPFSMMKKGVLATVTALQPLYMGGQIINGNKLAAIQEEVRKLELEMTEKDVKQNVHTYYWKLVALRGNMTTLDAAAKQLEEVHRLTGNYVKEGVINRNDLLRVELKQQEIASQRLTLENGIELVRMLLAQLCGMPLKDFDIQEENILEPQTPDSYQVPAEVALAGREEVRLLDHSVRAGELQVRMERGKNLPTVAVGASGVYMNLFEESQGNLIGLATVSVPISDWWSGSHKIRKAKLALEQSRIQRRDTQEKLQIDILSAWNNLRESYAQIEIARRSVAQSEENLRMMRHQYEAGTQDMTELLDAITLHTQSSQSLVKSCADYQSSIAAYKRKTE